MADIVDFTAHKEGRVNNKEEQASMNTSPADPRNPENPSKFIITKPDQSKVEVVGFLGLYPEFIIIGNGKGGISHVFNSDAWFEIDNQGEVVVTEEDLGQD